MTAAWLPTITFGLDMRAGPAGGASYVVGDWPRARVAARTSDAAVAMRNAAARITPRNPVAQAAER